MFNTSTNLYEQEKDIIEKGLDLGENAVQQQVAIEENVLHIIDHDERIEELEKENKALKKENTGLKEQIEKLDARLKHLESRIKKRD